MAMAIDKRRKGGESEREGTRMDVLGEGDRWKWRWKRKWWAIGGNRGWWWWKW